ncbi:outer membrane lipoprotein LolB [Kushneria avicenniae]|uniref:Outer-membrane lipoprotein LolB n=1 Tax=Kushneria avicenniae TaxID=402385 RepID=A0A1I1MBI3_9GAMM|nr:lipoprotein insertase outer membrane protein LolB [Kushneria avicenniae]SFC82202.1 outer membrane lipoprotein LolB [Kushneria avicenniae]
MTSGPATGRTLRFLTLALILLLAGCATQAPSQMEDRHPGDWRAQQSRLEALDTWTAAGKVGIRTPEDSQSANLDWTQRASQYRISVSGPWGTGRNTLEGDGQKVTLTNGDGTFQAATPEALMAQQMGWSLPLSSLVYWVRGLPDPRAPHSMSEDDAGFPATLDQAGWHIDYRDWSRADGLWLPRRLVMTYDDIRTTLVINRWQPEQAELP